MRRIIIVTFVLLVSLSACGTGDLPTESGKGAPKTTIETVTAPNQVNLVDERGSTVIEFGASAQYINGVYCTTTNEGVDCDYANDLGRNKVTPQ